MKPSLRRILARLKKANGAFARSHPGPSGARQPVHTVYGGAHIFKADTARKLGDTALKILQENAPDAETFAQALELPASTSRRVYDRVVEKLRHEPVEDFRIDFEDGYGNRPDAEEDGHARSSALEVAKGRDAGTLSPFIGIRIKPFTDELVERSARTLEIFLKELGPLPPNFVVTLPKPVIPEQVTALADLMELIEHDQKRKRGELKIELMIETPASIAILRELAEAAKGRCAGADFGTYDFTAGCGITAKYQTMTHFACDTARQAMQIAYAGMDLPLSDGATNIMPVPVHRGANLTLQQIDENRASVHRGWKLHYDHVRHSLENAFYQGWDLHPAQLPTRYAAVFSFFLESLPSASERLRNFVEKLGHATLAGDVFDDAATGQGLLNFFLLGLSSGAFTEQEAAATGVTAEELRGRSFLKILKSRARG